MQPLAERMRPQSLDDYIGQKHLVGEGSILPPHAGVWTYPPSSLGTTRWERPPRFRQYCVKQLNAPFYKLSAVTSGVKEVQEVRESP